MRPLHTAGTLLIVAIWGLNFPVIRFGLNEFTPFTFATWRFVLGALPVLFVPRPNIPWATLAGIGGFMFAGQFVFLFFAMQAGLPPGLTSVLVQLQGPLTVVLAAVFLREHATRGQWLGLAVAALGVVLIGRSVEGTASVLAVGLALLSAWYKQGFDPKTGAIGWAKDYKKNGQLLMLPPGIAGVTPGAVSEYSADVRSWKLQGLWIKSFKPDGFDHDNDGDNTLLNVLFSVDRAFPEAMET